MRLQKEYEKTFKGNAFVYQLHLVVVFLVHKYIKIYQIVLFKYMQFICQLDLNKLKNKLIDLVN